MFARIHADIDSDLTDQNTSTHDINLFDTPKSAANERKKIVFSCSWRSYTIINPSCVQWNHSC